METKSNNKLIYSFNAGPYHPSMDLLSAYSESLIFDGIKRNLWIYGYQFGNTYYGSWWGENFNDFKNNTALGTYSHAEGTYTTVTYNGKAGHAEGYKTYVNSYYGHAEGEDTKVEGIGAHAEGHSTYAYGDYSHASGTNTNALGINSHSEGLNTTAIGENSHAEGDSSVAFANGGHTEGLLTYTSGEYSHAEGTNTYTVGHFSHSEGSHSYTNGAASHAEGYNTYANGDHSHAEGCYTFANGTYSHANGNSTYANGEGSFTNGKFNSAYGNYSVASGQSNRTYADYSTVSGNSNVVNTDAQYSNTEGWSNTNNGKDAHIEGHHNVSYAEHSHAEGCYINIQQTAKGAHGEGSYNYIEGAHSHVEGGYNSSYSTYSHSEGIYTINKGEYSHTEGSYTYAEGTCSHAEGNSTYALGMNSHSEGEATYAKGVNSHSEGNVTYAEGNSSHSEGAATYAKGAASHAEGRNTYANGDGSHSEGNATYAIGIASHSEGFTNKAVGDHSHVEGCGNVAKGRGTHAEGCHTYAEGIHSHTEGWYTHSYGIGSHAEGNSTYANGSYSHAEGYYTKADGEFAHSQGLLTNAAGAYSFATGSNTYASGENSITFGNLTYANGNNSLASGDGTYATGDNSQAFGVCTYSEAECSSTFNIYNQAYNAGEFSIGSYNRSYHLGYDFDIDSSGNYIFTSEQEEEGINNDHHEATIFSIGDGTSYENRHNIIEVNKSYSYIANQTYIGSYLYADLSYSYVAWLGQDSSNRFWLGYLLKALLNESYYHTPVWYTKFVGVDTYNNVKTLTPYIPSYLSSEEANITLKMEVGTKFRPGFELYWPTPDDDPKICTRMADIPGNPSDYSELPSSRCGYSYGLSSDFTFTYNYNPTNINKYADEDDPCVTDLVATYTTGSSLNTYTYATGYTFINCVDDYKVIGDITVSYSESSYMLYDQLRKVNYNQISYGDTNPWFEGNTVTLPAKLNVQGRFKWYCGFSDKLPNSIGNDDEGWLIRNGRIENFTKEEVAQIKYNITHNFGNHHGEGWITPDPTTEGMTVCEYYTNHIDENKKYFWIAIPSRCGIWNYCQTRMIEVERFDGVCFDMVTDVQQLNAMTMLTDMPLGQERQIGRGYDLYWVKFDDAPLGSVHDIIRFVVTPLPEPDEGYILLEDEHSINAYNEEMVEEWNREHNDDPSCKCGADDMYLGKK